MQLNQKLCYVILFLLLLSVLAINCSSKEQNIPFWNEEWSYRKEINIPISTSNKSSRYQPIDISFEFDNLCWAKNENEHSIRIYAYYNTNWYEVESQIYSLEYSDSSFHIKKCGVVFLIPGFANGKERYFIYYDDSKKPNPQYTDHLTIEDSYYYYEPISGISAEGDYYKITEDGYCVFGVGQKGKVIHRRLSQTVVKLKPKTKDFDITKSDNIASFCFSYHKGTEFEDEISSDEELVAKQILVDGNLMVEFRVISQSKNGNLRTSNIYKYYYCPTEKKRMNVHVKHEVLEDDYVEGVINVDGRYGAIISYQSKSEKIEKMRFGEIMPYLHIYSEDNTVREYKMNIDPEGKEREWIISYKDDCDLGKNAWFSYDQGETGKAQAIIFSSNSNLIKHGTEDRDGIQMKVAVNEYMDALGTEIDYAAINYGRNSYEKGGVHDLEIRNGLTIEYDAEFFTSENNGYNSVIDEVQNYKQLIKFRNKYDQKPPSEEQKIHTLTVVPRGSSRIMSHPFLSNITGLKITSIYGELYKGEELISKEYTKKPLLGPPVIKFPKLAAGDYLVKIYREIGKNNTFYVGVQPVHISEDVKTSIYCTWPKDIFVNVKDQKENLIKDFELKILKNTTVIDNCVTTTTSNVVFNVPINFLYDYFLEGYYKGFNLINKDISLLDKNIDLKFNLYDLTIDVNDKLNLPPGVNLKPFLTSPDMDKKIEIEPDKTSYGRYTFENLPKAEYEFHISYGSYSDIIDIELNSDKNINLQFNASFDLKIDILDSRGNNIYSDGKTIKIFRFGREVANNIKNKESISLPPGEYQLRVLSHDGKIIGVKNTVLNNDKKVKIVTNIGSILPVLVNILTLIFLLEIFVLFIIKKISLNSFLKIIAMALILISLFQPWWSLQAENPDINAMKDTNMYIVPQVMIEKTTVDSQSFYDLATIPEMFTNFVALLLLIVCSGFILIGLSFIPNILLKKRYSTILIASSVIFLILVAAAFSFGMSKITEISIGSLYGKGVLDVMLPDKNTVYMNAYWGLGLGFYLCIFAAVIAFIGGIIDYLKKLNFFRKLKTKIVNLIYF